MTDPVEIVEHEGIPLAYLIRGSFMPEQTTFLTPPEFKQQVGFVVYPAKGEVQRHVHVPLERRLVGTSEVLVVRKGRCMIDLYADDRTFVVSRELVAGDVVLLVAGGHGFRMIEDTVFLEIKQGPYTGLQEKQHF
jgi:hypothetical protein